MKIAAPPRQTPVSMSWPGTPSASACSTQDWRFVIRRRPIIEWVWLGSSRPNSRNLPMYCGEDQGRPRGRRTPRSASSKGVDVDSISAGFSAGSRPGTRRPSRSTRGAARRSSALRRVSGSVLSVAQTVGRLLKLSWGERWLPAEAVVCLESAWLLISEGREQFVVMLTIAWGG